MKGIFILVIILVSTHLCAQELPQFIQDKLDFCNSNLSEEQVILLRKELDALEIYFIRERLLADRSGASYRAIFERIAKKNDLNFEIDSTFELLDTLDFQVFTGCFYKVLTPDQLSQLTSKHQEVAERIAEPTDGDLTPALLAQRIIENLTNEDFNLQFYRVSSLLIFYRIATPAPPLNFGLPPFNKNSETGIQTIQVFLNDKSEIIINDEVLTLQASEHVIYRFLLKEPKRHGIEFTVSRSASYESYIKITEMFNSVYIKLQSEKGNIPKNIIFREPK